MNKPRDLPALGNLIGKGGMGKVYNLKEGPQDQVLKTIPSLDRESMLEAFFTSQVKHPDVIHATNVYFSPNRKEIGLQLPRARSLEWKNLPTHWPDMRDILLQAVCGIDQLHRNGILHLDIKPENMLLLGMTGNDLVLSDLGLAAPLATGSSLGTRGTPGYFRKPYQAGIQADLEALVTSLWILIASWISSSPNPLEYRDGANGLIESVDISITWPAFAQRLLSVNDISQAAKVCIDLYNLLHPQVQELDIQKIRQILLPEPIANDYTCFPAQVEEPLQKALHPVPVSVSGSINQRLTLGDFYHALKQQYRDYRWIPALATLAQLL